MRLQSPRITFKITAILKPKKQSIDEFEGRYLPSGVPGSINLLESLKSDPAIQGSRPRLSAARLSRISTLPNDLVAANETSTLRTREPRVFSALPAISSRVRYARENGRTGRPSIIASLDIETAPFSGEDVQLHAIDIELSDGSIEDLNRSFMPLLPIQCRAKDNLVFLFRLTTNGTPSDNPNQTSARTVLITVHAVVLVSSSCQPKIQMRWKTEVDFSNALNPKYKVPGQSIQRPRRPSSLSRASSNTNRSNSSTSTREPDPTADGAKIRQQGVLTTDFGTSVTVTTPQSATVGQTFSWVIQILNRSRQPRQFTLKVILEDETELSNAQGPKPVLSSTGESRNARIAEAVIDENTTNALQKRRRADMAQIFSLSTGVRTGCVNIGLQVIWR